MDNGKIIIRKSPTADTRTADHVVTRDELLKSSVMHIKDVARAMRFFAEQLEERAYEHDYTKLTHFDEFYEMFHNAQLTGEWHGDWYNGIHCSLERHHLKDGAPEDVDLIDVIEQICDCVMAGLARSGHYRTEDLPGGLLEKAYENTIRKLLSMVEVKE